MRSRFSSRGLSHLDRNGNFAYPTSMPIRPSSPIVAVFVAVIVVGRSTRADGTCADLFTKPTEAILSTITQYKLLRAHVAQFFPSGSYDPMLAFEILVTTSSLSADGQFVPLRLVRERVAFDITDTAAKRAMRALHDLEFWESTDNPTRRTEKLVRLTPLGVAVVDGARRLP